MKIEILKDCKHGKHQFVKGDIISSLTDSIANDLIKCGFAQEVYEKTADSINNSEQEAVE